MLLRPSLGIWYNFNPRTRVGCDRAARRKNLWPSYFNPRTRVGCDAKIDTVFGAGTSISIHAPGWGATIVSIDCFKKVVFQSTHPGGVRQVRADKMAPYLSFQSTHPGGVRRGRRRHGQPGGDFNPRTRVGCDPPSGSASALGIYFNPRTRVGCDGGWHCQNPAGNISIHAPGWGATTTGINTVIRGVFQSTHPGGVRHARSRQRRQPLYFNPRTRVGCDSALSVLFTEIKNFNPRTRVGCDE